MPAAPRRSRTGRTRAAGALLLALAAARCAAPPGGAPPPEAPRAPVALLRVFSSPAGARIILDGAPTSYRTPTGIPGLAPGRHRVLLTLAGHRNWEGSVEIPATGTARLEAKLSSLGSGSVGLASVPAGAQIFVDGEPTNLVTPAVAPGLTVGTHTIQLRREGYESWSQAVVVMQGRILSLQAVLTPSRGSQGHLAVHSRPPRAAIALDGYPTGKLTPDTLYAIQAGSHRVELTLEGHRPWRGDVTVRESQVENLLVTLQPLPARAAGGARVVSDPPGASVILNGVLLRDRTPLEIERLAPGIHPVEITRPGCRPWRGEITVAPGRRTDLGVTLEPAETPAPPR